MASFRMTASTAIASVFRCSAIEGGMGRLRVVFAAQTGNRSSCADDLRKSSRWQPVVSFYLASGFESYDLPRCGSTLAMLSAFALTRS